MANLNPERLKANLSAMVKSVLEAQNKVGIVSMLNLQADMIERVFDGGKDVDGTPIGKYSTKPLYVSLKGQTSQYRSSSLKGKGKYSNSSKFENGNPRKSQYFPDGYSGFRAAVGRQNSKVDLRLSGSLLGSIQVGQTQGAITLGFNNDEQFKKAVGNEARFNKTIFSASEPELKSIEDAWEKASTDAFFSSFDK